MNSQQKRDRNVFEETMSLSRKKQKQKSTASGSGDHVRDQSRVPHEVSTGLNRSEKPGDNPARQHQDRSPAKRFSKPVKGAPPPLPPLPPITDYLAKQIFTHQSAAHGPNITKVSQSYERLEFLGDAYIEHIASDLIYNRYTDFPAGRLSQQREVLVKNETLAQFAVAYGFDQRLDIKREVIERESNQAKAWTKIKGDLVEAYVAGIVLSDPEKGFDTAREWLCALWEEKLRREEARDVQGVVDPMAKSELSKRIISPGTVLEYVEEAPSQQEKKAGKVWFSIAVLFSGWGFEKERLGGGKGLSKQEAGQRAASEALGSVITAQISRTKAAHDQKRKEEREQAEAGDGALKTVEEHQTK
ncbi:uncharacterized protein KY384_000268 [Bacidia gigantensis]|uniref:uncharacterized protein n=1 Tax=Bacidia gigantensis TaxID=2732470 RepID=UPI001D03B107|nr:uncharacterized protein KY384_000268 [Bacidia gigantensis]KAG8526275.1 hypothetical protein KY384_000268 [Bacidia gigantensis]